MGLQSFGSNIRAVVFGANGGIGTGFVEALQGDPSVAEVHGISRKRDGPGDKTHRCDALQEDQIKAVAAKIAEGGPVDLVLVAIGLLHGAGVEPEKTWRHLDADVMARVFAVNAIAPTMIAKHMLPLLAKERKTAFAALSARVGSISDNRLGGWLSYRSSKAALNMSIRTLSIELARTNRDALIVGLHPGTVETNLSYPFRSNVPKEQLFSPEMSVSGMLAALDSATTKDSGTVMDYAGDRIDP